MPEIILKVGREKSVLRRHPWIFSGAIARAVGTAKSGETVDVVSSKGEFLARAAYNPISNIAGRIWTWDENEPVDAALLEKRIKQAILVRQKSNELINQMQCGCVHARSDGLPGLILDRYAEFLVVQFLTGVEYWKKTLVG
jgi:23S rRNA (cytosine1962-C5)-methyltransferase